MHPETDKSPDREEWGGSTMCMCPTALGGGGICSVHHTQRDYLGVRGHRTHTDLKFSPRTVKDCPVKLKGQ